MADARTLPGDLFVPEVALESFGVEFVTSLEAMALMGMGPEAPIRITGFGELMNGGQFVEAPVIQRIADLESRRDITSDADVETKKFGTRNDRGVLINRKIGPASITTTSEQLAKMGEGALSIEFGRQAARLTLETIQSFAINALRGAVGAMTATPHTKSVWAAGVRTNMSTALLAQIAALMGDKTADIKAWVFRSESYWSDLLQHQLGQGVQGIADEASKGMNPQTLGKLFAVVDDAALTVADGGFDKYYTLGVGAGSIEVEFTRPLVLYAPEQRLKSENVERVVRGDYDFALRVPGLAFSNSVANPTKANILDTANWTDNADDDKEVGIVIGEHNFSGN